MKVLNCLLTVLLLIVLLFFSSDKTYASNFSTDYNVTYFVLDNATTRVTFDISLTNDTSQFYASSYKLILGFTDIKEVNAKDLTGSITPEISKVKDGTQIAVNFNNKVVGIGNKQNFSVSFNTNEIAQHSGNVWEVNIPGISEQNDFSNFNVKVVPPPSSQKLLYIKPQVSITNNSNVISFSQNQLGNSGISIAYGNFQNYKFDLNYHLKNNNLFPVKSEIALPPQTNYQDIQISSIDPEPSEVRKDTDGNWLAEFLLKPRQEITVNVKGYSRLYIEPKKEELTEVQAKIYTQPTKFWESNNVEIKKLAKTLKTPRQIYDFVTNKLTYDFSRVEDNQVRLGAVKALSESDSAVCLEFTDLFVALARASGIPARAVEGYANTQNAKERPLSLIEDILHAWPEYYDSEKKAWVMVDPTWANTTKGVDYFNVLDLDHFAFVIKGRDSEYPIPAGGYKQTGQEQIKDVLVEASQDFPTTKKELQSILDVSPNQVFFLPVKGVIIVRNIGSVSTDYQSISLESDLAPKKLSFNLPSLLPFQEQKIKFELKSEGITTGKRDIKLETPNQVIVKSIKISLLPVSWLVYILGGLIIVIFITIVSFIAYKSWRLYVLRQQREDYLRGKSPKY